MYDDRTVRTLEVSIIACTPRASSQRYYCGAEMFCLEHILAQKLERASLPRNQWGLIRPYLKTLKTKCLVDDTLVDSYNNYKSERNSEVFLLVALRCLGNWSYCGRQQHRHLSRLIYSSWTQSSVVIHYNRLVWNGTATNTFFSVSQLHRECSSDKSAPYSSTEQEQFSGIWFYSPGTWNTWHNLLSDYSF